MDVNAYKSEDQSDANKVGGNTYEKYKARLYEINCGSCFSKVISLIQMIQTN